MTLQQFKYAVAIADKGNINKAAQELFISQPSLTNAVRELENEMHFDCGRYAAENGISLVIGCGELAKEICMGAGGCGMYFSSKDELISALPLVLNRGDNVLVKASRGMHFEDISEAVKKL